MNRHVFLLLEDQSMETALRHLLPRIVGAGVTYDLLSFGGKPDLIAQLPNRLAGYSAWIPENFRIGVLLDLDVDDCHRLKAELEACATGAGLATLSTPRRCELSVQVMNRIAIEELEAWFFGDCDAIRAAYPRVAPTLEHRAAYRDPDGIKGGTWEALERVLQRAGHHAGGLRKVAAADEIARHMVPERNRSRSFRAFCNGLARLLA